MMDPAQRLRFPRLSMTVSGFGVLATVVLLAGCGAPVAVTPPEPAFAACDDLAQELPKRVEGQDRRTTTPTSSATAAWGDPPMVLRCGVGTPVAYTPTASLVEVGGVSWFAEPLSAGVRFTTIGRVVNVEFTVPDAYSPEAYPLIDLTGAITKTVPTV